MKSLRPFYFPVALVALLMLGGCVTLTFHYARGHRHANWQNLAHRPAAQPNAAPNICCSSVTKQPGHQPER